MRPRKRLSPFGLRSRMVAIQKLGGRSEVASAVVAVSGFSSEVGKTTLVCELLRALPGWEAIKLTRGHYRSCGKDPRACCVSHLLGDEPLVRSGRAETYALGKDTGRYWDAGASNVHWVIAANNQVEEGIKCALERVESDAVFIEGNSFTQFVQVDFVIMVARADATEIKPTARRALSKAAALYLSDEEGDRRATLERFALSRVKSNGKDFTGDIPIYTREELP